MSETTTIVCPSCTGTGMESTDPEDASTCLLCGGSGGVEATSFEGVDYLLMRTADQADLLVSDDNIQDVLEGWFGDRRTVPEEDCIDRIVRDHGSQYATVPFEIEEYDNPAARRLLSRARKIKKELNA